MLNISKLSLYYIFLQKFSSHEDIKLLNILNDIYSEFSCCKSRRMITALENKGFIVGRKLIKKSTNI
jgi:hypothetical protein